MEGTPLSTMAHSIAKANPVALETRASFTRPTLTSEAMGGRYIDGSLFASMKTGLQSSVLHRRPSILTARRQWFLRHKGHVVTAFGGDYAVGGATLPGHVLLRIPADRDGSTDDQQATKVYHPGTATHGINVADFALSNCTVYKDGPLSSLSVTPPPGVEINRQLRHRLLYEGCGYQARPVSAGQANTAYRVVWPTNGEPPRVFLVLTKEIPVFGEVTRPKLLAAKSTMHFQE